MYSSPYLPLPYLPPWLRRRIPLQGDDRFPEPTISLSQQPTVPIQGGAVAPAAALAPGSQLPYLQFLLQRRQDQDRPLTLPTSSAYYRGDQSSDTNPLIMAKPIGGGQYAERLIGPEGQSIGFGDRRDYEPLAQPTAPVSPTIAIRPRRVLPDVTQALPDVTPPFGTSNEPFGMRERRTQPRDYIADDAQYLRDLENKPRSRVKAILEGLGGYAASGIGLNLPALLHPGGTEVERARRQLATDVELQKQQSDVQEQQSTINLRNKQIEKLQRELDDPDTSDAEKAEAQAVMNGMREFAGQMPSPLNDAKYAALVERAANLTHPITLPATYGPKPTTALPKVPTKGTRIDKGIKYQTEYDPESKTWVYSLGPNGERIVEQEAEEQKPIETPAQQAKREGTHEKFRKLAEGQDLEFDRLRGAVNPRTGNREGGVIAGLYDQLGRERAKLSAMPPGDTNETIAPYKRQQAIVADLAARVKNTESEADKAMMAARGHRASMAEYEAPKPTAPSLTIEGAIERFQQVKRRKPTKQEIANMQAALAQ